MQIRIRSTGAVVYENEFRSMYPNTGFPAQLSEAIINEFGGDVVFEGPQASPTRYQTAFRDGVQQINGKWFTKYSVANMDDNAKAAANTAQATSVRNQRDEKLKSTDWTQLTDAPVNSALWATYRQSLRDITSQDGFPWDITWPTQPTE